MCCLFAFEWIWAMNKIDRSIVQMNYLNKCFFIFFFYLLTLHSSLMRHYFSKIFIWLSSFTHTEARSQRRGSKSIISQWVNEYQWNHYLEKKRVWSFSLLLLLLWLNTIKKIQYLFTTIIFIKYYISGTFYAACEATDNWFIFILHELHFYDSTSMALCRTCCKSSSYTYHIIAIIEAICTQY
jgi:hypothetical protein